MSSVFNICTNFIHCFEPVKLSYNQNKTKQVCRVETYSWTKVIPLSRIQTHMDWTWSYSSFQNTDWIKVISLSRIRTFVQIPWQLNISNEDINCYMFAERCVRHLTKDVFQTFDQSFLLMVFSILQTCFTKKKLPSTLKLIWKGFLVHGQSSVTYLKFLWCIIQITNYFEWHEIPNQFWNFL